MCLYCFDETGPLGREAKFHGRSMVQIMRLNKKYSIFKPKPRYESPSSFSLIVLLIFKGLLINKEIPKVTYY